MVMKVYKFKPGEASMLTADLCKEVAHGDCSKCPGILSADELGPGVSKKDVPVFCSHECHKNKETVQ